MKNVIKLLIIIIVLMAAIISIRDYFTYEEKLKLHEKSSMYQEELIAFSKILINREQLEEKYRILRNRKINNDKRETLLKEIEDFLINSKKMENKFSHILDSYNSIANRYNNLPKQILWYKNLLPKVLKIKTDDDYLQILKTNKSPEQ